MKKIIVLIFIVYLSHCYALHSKKDLYLAENIKLIDIALKFNASVDSLSFLPANYPFIVFSPESKVFLVNGTRSAEFEKMDVEKIFLYHNIAYRDFPWGQLSSHTHFNYHYQNQTLPAVFIDPLRWQLEKSDTQQNQNLFFYMIEQLGQQMLRTKYNAYYQVPSRQYPILNEENRAMKTIETDLLIKAWQLLLQGNKDAVKPVLEQFFSLRRVRWTKDRSYIMPFEQNEEIRLGYPAFQAYSILNHFHTYMDSVDVEEKKYLKKHFSNVNSIEYIYHLINSINDSNAQSIHKMTGDALKLSGMLQFLIYTEMGWKIDDMGRRDLWYLLNDKTTISDSLEKAYVKDITDSWEYKEILKQVRVQNMLYQENYNFYSQMYQQKKGTEFILTYDHIVDELIPASTKKFVLDEGKQQVIPQTSRYVMKSAWIDFYSENNSYIKTITPKNRNLKWKTADDYEIWIDHYIVETRDSLNIEYNHLEIKSKDFNLITNTPGDLEIKNNVVNIKIVPRIRYHVDEEWWEGIEELNYKLIQRGVPGDWFINQVNHEKFKIYLNMKRLFTSMPEHRVKRGEVSQDAYMKNFGVDQKVQKGIEFIKQYQDVLEKAEKKNGIHYEMMMGILAIESDYGNPRFKGTFYTFPALVSQYLLLPRRERFSINELVSLYEYSKKTENDPYHFVGSYAGAAGWGQFIPSSMKAFFLDSNNDFSDIDIYSIEDNIVSIENYLFKNGLSAKNISQYDSRYKAVYSYNHSDSYVKAVLYIYDKLRELRTNAK
ncbi:MAG TPA: lytic murein transglycosylase [Candidatus Cloacimonadota bacterium]|nr:lytic murein transglycosylase [Candidatus Cloacimonadota bacterium]